MGRACADAHMPARLTDCGAPTSIDTRHSVSRRCRHARCLVRPSRSIEYLRRVAESEDATAYDAVEVLIADANGQGWGGMKPRPSEQQQTVSALKALAARRRGVSAFISDRTFRSATAGRGRRSRRRRASWRGVLDDGLVVDQIGSRVTPASAAFSAVYVGVCFAPRKAPMFARVHS